MVKICYRKPISISDLWVSTYDKQSDFYASAWQQGDSAVPLLVIRMILATLALIILTWSILESPTIYWLLYLTNWGITLLTISLIFGVVVCFYAVYDKPQASTELPWYMSTYWFLFNISTTTGLLISTLYWTLLYDPQLKAEMGVRFFYLEVCTHGVNSILIMLEVLASRMPVRLLQLYQPLGVGLWYAAFSAIYFYAGGTDINGFPFVYEILDWRHPKRSAIVVSGAAVMLILIYFLLSGVVAIRDKITSSIFPPNRREYNVTLDEFGYPV